MKVTTKRGDSGMTDLFGGRRVSKADPKIELIGRCDEIQSLLGIVKNMGTKETEKQHLTSLQTTLYQIMGTFAGAANIEQREVDGWVQALEQEQARLLETTPISAQFVIPGSTLLEAWYQFARTRVRSFERCLVAVSKKNPQLAKYIPFFNRLSDYLFIQGQTHGLSPVNPKV